MGAPGIRTPILAAVLPATVATALTAVKVAGNKVAVRITTVTGGCGDVTITAKTSSDGATYYDVMGSAGAASWICAGPTTAGTYQFALEGLTLANGEWLKLYYKAGAAAGTIAIDALTFTDEGGGGSDIGAVSDGATTAPVPMSTTFVSSASLTDAGAGYPFTAYWPSATGLLIGERRRLQADIIVTGTAVPQTLTATLQGRQRGSTTWRDISLDGWSHINGTDLLAAWVSSSATPTEDSVEWKFLSFEAIRFKTVITGASGPATILGVLHGR